MLSGECNRDRVDREIATRKILLWSTRSNIWESPGRRVRLGTSRHDVDLARLPIHKRGSKALVIGHPAAFPQALPRERPETQRKRFGECTRIARHHHVQLSRSASEHDVAHRAPHQLDTAQVLLGEIQQLTSSRQQPQSLEHHDAVLHRHPDGPPCVAVRVVLTVGLVVDGRHARFLNVDYRRTYFLPELLRRCAPGYLPPRDDSSPARRCVGCNGRSMHTARRRRLLAAPRPGAAARPPRQRRSRARRPPR